MSYILRTLVASLALALLAQLSGAQEPPAPRVRAELVTPVTQVVAGMELNLLLALELDPEWHVYWRNPGDGALPPTLRLAGADESLELRFPVPEVMFTEAGVSYGYRERVELPFRITVPSELRPGESFVAALEADWVACNEVCLREEQALELRLEVAVDAPAASPQAARVQAALDALPRASADFPVRLLECAGARLVLELGLPPGYEAERYATPHLLAVEPGFLRPSSPQVWRQRPAERTGQLELRLLVGAERPAVFEGLMVLQGLGDAPTQAFTLRIPLPDEG